MAEVQKADTSIFGNLQAPKGMSLSEMLGIQKSQYELSKLKELYPAMISKEQALSKTAGIESEKAGFGLQRESQLNDERKAIQAFMSDPRNWQNDKGETDINKVNSVLPAIAPLSGTEHATKLTTLANNHTMAENAKVNMTQNEKSVIASVYGALGRAGINDPKAYLDALNSLKKQYPDNKNIQQFVDSHISSLGLMGDKPNPNISKTAIQASEQLLTPPQQLEAFAPKVGLQNVGGLNVQSTTQPSVGGNVPTATYALPVIGGEQPTPSNAPSNAPTETKEPLFIERFSKRPETYPPQISELEKPSYEEGLVLRQKSSDIASDSSNLLTSIRAARKSIKESSGTAIGQGLRSAKQIFIANPELETLVKNAADIQARQGAILGAKTDSSRETISQTSPNANLSEKGLEKILERIEADTVNNMKFNKGLNAYIDKKGNVNGHLNASSFKNAWTNNFDADVFKYQNIVNSNMSKEEKAKAKKELLQGKDLTKFEKSLKNLHRLERGEN